MSALAGELGVPQRLARRLSAPMGRLFGLPGTGAAALLAGVLGGYPLGAAATSGLVERGALTPAEGARLLGFANNSGPAFLIGAAGAGYSAASAPGSRSTPRTSSRPSAPGSSCVAGAAALCQLCPRSRGPGPGPSRVR